jgi:hypothetical protein
MSKLKFFVLHCTATQEGKEYTAADIKKMHCSPPPVGRGWKQVGYSDMIHLDGAITNLVPYDNDQEVQPREITNGALGLNGEARHIVYVGGLDKNLKAKDTRTQAQITALKNKCYDMIAKHPTIKILGHNQVAAKACPCFDVPKWLISIGINKANIY